MTPAKYAWLDAPPTMGWCLADVRTRPHLASPPRSSAPASCAARNFARRPRPSGSAAVRERLPAVFRYVRDITKGESCEAPQHRIPLGLVDALRRRDTESMAAALAPDVVWQGVRPDLVCHGPDEVIAAFVTAYDANQEIDSLEVIGGEERIVLGARSPDLAIDQVDDGRDLQRLHDRRRQDHVDRGLPRARGRSGRRRHQNSARFTVAALGRRVALARSRSGASTPHRGPRRSHRLPAMSANTATRP